MFAIDIKKLCEDSHIISKEKGWLDTERSYAGLTDLMHSELAEALEDYRNNRGLDETYYHVKCRRKDPTGVSSEEVGYEHPTMSQKELDELKALPDVRDLSAKPCGIPIEFADFAIRIAQHCGTEGWDLAGALHTKDSMTRKLSWGDFEEMLGWAHSFVARSFLASKGIALVGTLGAGPAASSNAALDEIASAFMVVQDFCRHPVNGGPRINLAEAIALKQAYNMTRPHRHGGKKI